MLELKSKTARHTSWKSQHQPGEGLEWRRNGWSLSQARVQLAACTGEGLESYREKARKPKVSEKYCVGSAQCPTIQVKTWRKEMSGFSEEFREVGGLGQH